MKRFAFVMAVVIGFLAIGFGASLPLYALLDHFKVMTPYGTGWLDTMAFAIRQPWYWIELGCCVALAIVWANYYYTKIIQK